MIKKLLKTRRPNEDFSDAESMSDAEREGVAMYEKLEQAWGAEAATDTLWLTYQYMDATADLYNSVLNEAGVEDEDKPAYREMLVRHSEGAIVAAIWKALTPAHLDHLREYMRGARVIDPEEEHVPMLIDFALMYPDLRAAVWVALDEFFAQFIEDVKRMEEI